MQVTQLPHLLGVREDAQIDIVRALDCRMYAASGEEYVDFESGCWATPLGHGHPRMVRRMAEQAARVIHLGPMLATRTAEEAAQALLRHTPFWPDGKALFLTSGSEAVELGIRLAQAATGRKGLVTFSRTYLGAYGQSSQLEQAGWSHVDVDACLACPHGECRASCPCLSGLDLANTAAFVLEPVLAAGGGVIVPPSKCVALLAREMQAAGGLVLVDEVTTGLGRTGAWYGAQHHPITPDILAFAKGLGNGYPVSATVMSARVAARVEQTGLRYAQSHQNDPLGCAIATEVLATLEAEGLIERARANGEAFTARLRELKARHACVADVRGLGLMLVLELVPEVNAQRAWQAMLQRGYILGPSMRRNLLRFMPPLTISMADIDAMCRALDQVLTELSVQ